MNPVAAAKRLGDGFSAGWLKTQARAKAIPHTRAKRNAIGFTEADILAILELRRVEAQAQQDAPTSRSQARRRVA